MAPTGNGYSTLGQRVTVIGAGLVGALNACFLAKRGFQVDVYEKRKDMRIHEPEDTRSILLGLSYRGLEALSRVGLKEGVEKFAVPMYGRKIHHQDGSTENHYYGNNGQFVNSIDRRSLNKFLLSAAEQYPNLKIHFGHRIVKVNFESKKVEFKSQDEAENKVVMYDVLIGNDGIYSKVRANMMENISMNYSQQFISHRYMQMVLPAAEDGKHQMEANYLHVWPRYNMVIIAPPNVDGTFTTTIFFTDEQYASMQTEEGIAKFFREWYPDMLEIYGEDTIVKRFNVGQMFQLLTVKVSPYHLGESAMIMGDAAHGVVPFFGQGMNAGFEDCIILDELLDKYNNDFSKVMPMFTKVRNEDGKAVCDLSLNHYYELSTNVNSKVYLMRKKMDYILNAMMPSTWESLYAMVTFTRTPYTKCISRRKWQNQILKKTIGFIGVAATLCTGYLGYLYTDWCNC